ncbi:MAG: hypothetical protein WDW36_001424 [Sanguina aurantia]
MLRKSLEEELGVDLTAKKLLIRAEINRILAETQPGDEEEGSEEGGDGEEGGKKKEAMRRSQKKRRCLAQGTTLDHVLSHTCIPASLVHVHGCSVVAQSVCTNNRAGKGRSGGGYGSMLSEAMQAFLGLESCGRHQVVKAIWVYIKEHSLQNPKDKRKIMLDDKLSTLFKAPLNMFSLNKQLSKHCWTDDSVPAHKPEKTSKASKAGVKREISDDDADEDVHEPKAKRQCGFTMPFKVSRELAEFVGQEEISRPQTSKFVAKYANDNNLRNGTVVTSDATLFALTKQKTFTLFGSIKHFSHHFPASKSAAKK